MNKKIKFKRMGILIPYFAILIVLMAGITYLTINGEKEIRSKNYKYFLTTVEVLKNCGGRVRSCDGDILWGPTFSGYRDCYNLVGDIKNPRIENSICVQNENTLFNTDNYNVLQGKSSLITSGEDVTLTLNHNLNKKMFDFLETQGVKTGSLLVMDRKTGKIRVAVSLPSAGPEDTMLEEGALLNRNFMSAIPGSTMKIVTTVLLTEEDKQNVLADETTQCNGSYRTKESEAPITCATRRGEQNIYSALGYSCNTYFAEQIEKHLNINSEEVKKNLKKMGIECGTEGSNIDVDGIKISGSYANFSGSGFSSTWSLIGEGEVGMNPIQMCRIVAAITNKGVAATPHLLEGRQLTQEDFMEADVAEKVFNIWKTGFDTYYKGYDSKVTLAKTGTAEYDGNVESKLLVGYIESADLVFFLELRDFNSDQITTRDVVNEFCSNLNEQN